MASKTDLADAYLAKKGIKGMAFNFRQKLNRFLVEFDDADADQSGTLTTQELRSLNKSCECLKDRGVAYCLEKLDADGDNLVSRDEFVRLFFRTWAKRAYGDNFNAPELSVDKVCDLMKEEGYEKASVKAFITKRKLNNGGKVKPMKFIQDFFDPTIAH